MQFHEFRHEMKNPHFKKAMERISELESENAALRRERELEQRISELEVENRRMREALDLFWSQSLAIETLARRAYGESSQIYQNVLAAILKAQEFYKNLPKFYKNLPKATRAALSQEENP